MGIPMSDDLTSLGDYQGRARLFPLPNLVLFPYVIQPLHLFEPRYRQLMEDALRDDRLIAMALLQPGWEENYHKSPPIYPVVCLGRVHKEERLPDGRWNLLLHGLARARVESELMTDRPYRVARVRLLSEEDVASPQTAKDLRRQLGRRMSRWFAAQAAALVQMEKLLHSDLTLGALCDVFGFALPIGIEMKQQLLEDADVELRARRLIAHLEENVPPEPAKPSPRPFPPDFSTN
jgi:Lon protease-like protein